MIIEDDEIAKGLVLCVRKISVGLRVEHFNVSEETVC
jgi:hypothetical protein